MIGFVQGWKSEGNLRQQHIKSDKSWLCDYGNCRICVFDRMWIESTKTSQQNTYFIGHIDDNTEKLSIRDRYADIDQRNKHCFSDIDFLWSRLLLGKQLMSPTEENRSFFANTRIRDVWCF